MKNKNKFECDKMPVKIRKHFNQIISRKKLFFKFQC